ncbi:pyridoxal phosphate-dependent aminotransferase [Schaalia hyovaginalis]|uniref:Aspartate/methionine/tyrosine aminotransferase n=1 Tax=Schaalia hyovaginalis TaxID=29316 RepID=A0A923E3G5_9ACTO|nr:pyridoxal phosphate-dependent aminotransferase [Schaalia hyovaginalis]MBB6335229.1 aspartate/methionine/tyrosine aminotransferase [Schaalia hyovaginalis]MDY2667930.1 pyridoxal phosphate-dependent aminotransferase [Schaalia hyovaginalis]
MADFLSVTQNRVVDPDDLYLLSSTSQAYSWLIKLLCDPGDAVLSPAPGYPLVESIARLEAVRALAYPLHRYGHWEVDAAAVAEILDGPEGGAVRALVLISPNNPTGSYVSADEYSRLVEVCRRHDLPLIADEVFFDYRLADGVDRVRIAGRDEVLTFALDGLSKRLAAPHAKLAWIEVSGPADLVAEAKMRMDAIADDFLPLGALITERMPEFCEQIPEQTRSVRARCLRNLAALRGLVSAEPSGTLELLEPEGGWNALVRFPSAIDEDDLITRLIVEDALTVQPGYFFDMPDAGYVSVSLLLEAERFRDAASMLIGRLGHEATALA